MKLHVEVTVEDLVKGRRLGSFRCPIALAISRAAGQRASASAEWGAKLWVGADDHSKAVMRARLPEEACRFIRQFDFGLVPVEPFAMDLEFSPFDGDKDREGFEP